MNSGRGLGDGPCVESSTRGGLRNSLNCEVNGIPEMADVRTEGYDVTAF